MDFRTEIQLSRAPFTIGHHNKVFMAGSCFAENIFGRMKEMKFDVLGNPSGILFNPASIGSMVSSLAEGRIYTHNDLQTDGSKWFSWHHHGSFSGICAGRVLDGVNQASIEGAEALQTADTVIITFGTAWIYRLASTGEVVANCHKQPSTLFTRHRLSTDEITGQYGELLSGILKEKNVVFTVSPVRHLKDGFAENSLSKAILRAAIAELCDKYSNAYYFPAFEIVNDDLRDYRFYNEDMIHPSDMAIDYIWKKFTDWCISPDSVKLFPKLEKLASAMNHRTQDGNTVESRAFARKTLMLADELHKELPGADFSKEIEYLSSFE